ncbi:MAG: PQQ-binding-like beta-propeller repeat protein, partial [Myxococcota bacterium]|nr:PQQ-binding-like beta-propeller repeat protein [Myxococcota bacterium]
MTRFLAGVAGLILISQVLGCGAFLRPPDVPVDSVALDWARPLYELESFSSQPQEMGRPLLLDGRSGKTDGVLVVPSADRAVRGLNARSGAVLWTLNTLGRNQARPAVGGDMVFVPSMDGHLYAVEPYTGVLRWKSDIIGRGGLVTTPVYAEGEDGVSRVFVTASDNRLIAFDAQSG